MRRRGHNFGPWPRRCRTGLLCCFRQREGHAGRDWLWFVACRVLHGVLDAGFSRELNVLGIWDVGTCVVDVGSTVPILYPTAL